MLNGPEVDIYGNLNALELISVLIFTGIILWKFGQKKPRRILMAIACGVVADLVFALPFMYKCGAGNNPKLQAFIPAISLLLIVMFVNQKKIVWLASMVLIGSGFLLCWQFSHLVIKKGSYTGEPTHFACSQKNENKIAKKLWHTSMTGLYKIERNRFPSDEVIK